MKKKLRKKKSKERSKNPGFRPGEAAWNEVVASWGRNDVENEGGTFAHQLMVDWAGNSGRPSQALRAVAGWRALHESGKENLDPRQAESLNGFFRDIGEAVMLRIHARDADFFTGIVAVLASNVRSNGSKAPDRPLEKGLLAYFQQIRESDKGAKISATKAQEFLSQNGFGERRLDDIREAFGRLGLPRDSKRGPKPRRR